MSLLLSNIASGPAPFVLLPAQPLHRILLTMERVLAEARHPSSEELRYLETQLALLKRPPGGPPPIAPPPQPSLPDTPDEEGNAHSQAARPAEAASPRRANPFQERLLAELRSNIGNPRYKTQDLCHALCTSKSRLHPRAHQVLGTSPMKYLQHLRLEQAAALLLSTPDTIDVIAEQCGFCSGSHLATRFKEVYGCTPGAWRELGGR
jgi:AraC-like DNA-binding protein